MTYSQTQLEQALANAGVPQGAWGAYAIKGAGTVVWRVGGLYDALELSNLACSLADVQVELMRLPV